MVAFGDFPHKAATGGRVCTDAVDRTGVTTGRGLMVKMT
jgi:hypothetical protein